MEPRTQTSWIFLFLSKTPCPEIFVTLFFRLELLCNYQTCFKGHSSIASSPDRFGKFIIDFFNLSCFSTAFWSHGFFVLFRIDFPESDRNLVLTMKFETFWKKYKVNPPKWVAFEGCLEKFPYLGSIIMSIFSKLTCKNWNYKIRTWMHKLVIKRFETLLSKIVKLSAQEWLLKPS